MTCSLNCFWDFYQAPNSERKAAIIRRYKKSQSGEAKGRSTYYVPVVNAIKDKLCTGGSVEEKIAAIKEACVNSRWTDRLNDIRIEANLQAYHAFRSVFGVKSAKFLPCPRMQFHASENLAINLQPDLFFEQDKKRTMIKLGVSKRKRPEELIRMTLQMFHRGASSKDLNIPIDQIAYLQVRTGKGFVERSLDKELENYLRPTFEAFVNQWETTSA